MAVSKTKVIRKKVEISAFLHDPGINYLMPKKILPGLRDSILILLKKKKKGSPAFWLFGTGSTYQGWNPLYKNRRFPACIPSGKHLPCSALGRGNSRTAEGIIQKPIIFKYHANSSAQIKSIFV